MQLLFEWGGLENNLIEEKKCSRCGKLKPISEFHKDNSSKDGLKCYCKECARNYYLQNKQDRFKYSKRWKEENQDKVKQYDKKVKDRRREFLKSLKKPCEKCGEERWYVIDFHHVDPATKEIQISSQKSIGAMKKEVDKCICLCRNCHEEFHYFYGRNPEHPKEALEEYLGRKLNEFTRE